MSNDRDPVAAIANPDRLAALDAYAILDTDAEASFDGIVLLARSVCAVPVALVSLVAADRQWFKARSGFKPCETDLSSSVCAHALGRTRLLVIPDLTKDERTRSNPLVTGEPGIRFYAGAPLTSPEGQTLGTLCVIDTVTRPGGLNEEQTECLNALAKQVIGLLNLRRVVEVRDQEIRELRAELAAA